MIRLKIALMLAVSAFSSSAIAAPYAVVFEVTRSPDGKVEKLAVSKVIDPKSGSTAAVKVDVPQTFIDAVREEIQEKPSDPEKPHYFTYFFFDPRYPSALNVGMTN